MVTKRGTILVTTEARQGQGGDWDNIDLLMRRSVDGGATWEPRRTLVSHEGYGEGPVNNCALVRDDLTGAVHVLYCHNYGRVFYMRSDDDGSTFSPAREITPAMEAFRTRRADQAYPWRVIATGPGHGLQLGNGRLIVPLWMSTGEGAEFGSGKLGHRPSVSSLIYSDDHGESWHCGDIVARTTDTLLYPSETAAVELSDGRVLFNMRSESDAHRRLVSVSPDGVSGMERAHLRRSPARAAMHGQYDPLFLARGRGPQSHPL